MKHFSLLLFLTLLAACNYDIPVEPSVTTDPVSIESLNVPADFDFSTTGVMKLHLTAEDAEGNTLKRVPFSVFLPDNDKLIELLTSTTGEDGEADVEFTLPSYAKKLVIKTPYIGLPAEKVVTLSSNEVAVVLGEENQEGFTGGGDSATEFLKKFNPAPAAATMQEAVQSRSLVPFSYMGTYSKLGKPNYLVSKNDVISQKVLDVINSSLPESRPVPVYHPEFLSDSFVSTLNLVSDGDVWVTFVHEAAGYRNALGYYTYPTASPPASVDNISNLKIIFPNTSFKNSGGNLVTGNKVYLGNFKAGTSVGWFLVPDGWNSSTLKVDPKAGIKFSDLKYNTFTSPAYRQHTVLLYDESLQKFILGMEDISRPGGDNDFNDAVFYVTVNPFSAIETAKVAPADNKDDDDGDGVSNAVDIAPKDPSIAFAAYTPAQGVFGTIAFEDLFPSKGDYDLNDVVVDYNYKEYLNSKNEIVKMDINLKLRATGGVLHNGFGIALGADASEVASVQGYKLTGNIITLTASGVEAGQKNAVIIAFDDALALLGGSSFANTNPKLPGVQPVSMTLQVLFKNPVTRKNLGAAPFNQFIFVGQVRGKEVHLPGYAPTQLANPAFFGTADDVTNPAKGIFYKTSNNMPYGIITPTSFKYTVERKPVTAGHLMFSKWVETGGASFPDWYLNKSEYQSDKFLY